MAFGDRFRTVPDFPKKGIGFIDITTLLKDGPAFAQAVDVMAEWAQTIEFDVIVSPEARGFILGAPLAVRLKKGFIPVRKPGKLPWHVERGQYELEYGEAVLEIHQDAVKPGERVLIVDDLLATGGTVKATQSLIERLGGEVVGMAFLVELAFLKGRETLSQVPVFSAHVIENP